MIAVASRGRGHRREVAAHPGFRHRDRGDQLAARDAGQPPLLLFVRAVREEVRRADVVVERETETGTARADALQLLADDEVVAEVRDAAAAVLLRDVEPEE